MKIVISVINGMLVIFQFCSCCRYYSLLKIVPQIELSLEAYGLAGISPWDGESPAWVIISLCASSFPKPNFIQEKVDIKGIF